MRGWVHSGLRLGFEIVGTALLHGHADRDTVQLIDAGTGDQFAVIFVEDLIADRMGQYHSGTALRCLNKRKRCSTFIKTLILPIWNGVFVKRLQTIMASRNLNQPCRAISLDDFRRDVARRREAVSEAEMPRNSGQRRTQSKQELLIAIQAAGGNW